MLPRKLYYHYHVCYSEGVLGGRTAQSISSLVYHHECCALK